MPDRSPLSNDPTNKPPSGTASQEQEDRDDIAAQGFLQLLNQLRIILLQDSVLLQAQFPRHSMWDDPIFAREDYTTFAEQIRQTGIVVVLLGVWRIASLTMTDERLSLITPFLSFLSEGMSFYNNLASLIAILNSLDISIPIWLSFIKAGLLTQ